MKLFLLSAVTLIATFILLLIGGLVNPMGASLACPDWYFVPTCNGELLPAMEGGVLYEHGHRLWASFVGMLTVTLAVSILKSAKSRALQLAGLAAVLLVALQGTLGGVTVLLGLNAFLSTLHLTCAMIFFCLMIFITLKTLPANLQRGMQGLVEHEHVCKLLKISTVLVFAQLILGGALRHYGAGLACGDDWIRCGESFWPSWSLGQLHMTHRIFGFLLALKIVYVAAQAQKFLYQAKLEQMKIFAALPSILVIAQIALGIFTVAFIRPIPMVVLHTGVGALLLGSLFSLTLLIEQRAGCLTQ